MVDKKLLEEQIARKKEELARLEAALLAESEKPGKESSSWLEGNGLYWAIGIAAVLIVFNGFQLMKVGTLVASSGGATGAAVLGGRGGSLDAYSTLAPALTAILKEEPVLPGYKTKVTKFPTISELAQKPKTGDPAQDAINALVPTGTPWYGAEAGVSFDDPIAAQNTWGAYEQSIQLSGELQQRYTNIINSFTCDYCCGSPQNPTIISRCGCGHARAWRGMAKWFLSKYGDKYNDAQIMGEMSRWKALWYPGPTVQRVLQEGAL